MAADARISVEGIEQMTANSAACPVRCLEGTVSLGDVFDTAVFTDGHLGSVSLRVAGLWRYGRPTDLLDPPHTAKLELTGRDALALPDITHLVMTANP